MGELPEELQPDQIRELEKTCPEIVNFLRKASQLGSPSNDEVSNLARRQETCAKTLLTALEGRMPVSLTLNILKQMDDPNFVDGVAVYVGFPDQVRTFVKVWMEKQGVQFVYTEPKREPS